MKMKKLIIYLFFIAICFLSCNRNKEKTTYYYYDDGNIKERYVYENKKEYDLKKNYQCTSYYHNGNIKEKFVFKDGEVDGIYYRYFETGELWKTIRLENGVKHGLEKTYNEEGVLMRELLYIDDEKVAWRNFTFFETIDSLYGYQVFHFVDGIGEIEGMYFIDENGEMLKNHIHSEYYSIISKKDTIKKGAKYHFDLEIAVNGGEHTIVEVLIGELDKEGNLIDTVSVFKSDTNERIISCYVEPTNKEGYNLVLGKVLCTQDKTMNNELYIRNNDFILYKEYYVKED